MECLFFVRDSASVTSLVSYFYFVVLLFIQHFFSSCYVQGSCVGCINVYRERNQSASLRPDSPCTYAKGIKGVLKIS